MDPIKIQVTTNGEESPVPTPPTLPPIPPSSPLPQNSAGFRPASVPTPRPVATPIAPRPKPLDTTVPKPATHVMPPKSKSPWLIVALIGLVMAALAGGGVYYWQHRLSANQSGSLNKQIRDLNMSNAKLQATNADLAKQVQDFQAAKKVDAYAITSASGTSPGGAYTVIETLTDNGTPLTIKTKAGKTIATKLPSPSDVTAMKLTNIAGYHFVGWNSSTKFVVEAVSASGSIYQFFIDTTSGAADSSTLRQIK